MLKRLILFFCLFAVYESHAADSLQIVFSKTITKTGDTLDFRCYLPFFAESKLTSATLNLWIEDLEKKKRWKFRYPIVNGEVIGSLAIANTVPDGRYAFNFLVQRGFFKVGGEVKDHDKKETAINYMMILRNNKGSYFDNAAVDAEGRFKLKSTLFQDSAYFIFSPVKKVRNNYLSIKIETPLDSVFTPVLAATRFITVGEEKNAIGKKNDTSRYAFQTTEPIGNETLPGVTVTGKFKKKVQQYDEMYSSGLFKRDDVMLFDGLEDDEISRYPSLLLFLQTKVPGLSITTDATGQQVAKWRNEIVDLYIDEVRMQPGDEGFVIPSEIAMIKVFRPPAQLSGLSGSAGAIAVYTKKGDFANNTRNKHNFIVRGYSAFDGDWK